MDTHVVLRPIASPLPLGFLALVLATVPFAAVQLGWVPPTEGRIAALAAVAATVPLQLVAALIGFLARDVAAATGMGVLAGTWGTVGLTTLTSPPGATSTGLGVLLGTAGICMFVPAAAASAKLVPASVMGLAGVRFLVTAAYELSASAAWKTAAGWVGLALGALALYAALALALEGSAGRTLLPVGRQQGGPQAGEPGIRSAL